MPAIYVDDDSFKDILIYAIYGLGIEDEELAEGMRAKGLVEFTGNQHNPEWQWKISALQCVPIESLISTWNIMYNKE